MHRSECEGNHDSRPGGRAGCCGYIYYRKICMLDMDFMKHFESTRYPRMLGRGEVAEGDQRPKICVIRYISKRPDYVVVVAVQNVRNICVMKHDGIFCCLARIDVAVVGGGERQYQWFIKYAKCTLLSTQLRFNGAFPSWLSTFVRWFVMEKVFFFLCCWPEILRTRTIFDSICLFPKAHL